MVIFNRWLQDQDPNVDFHEKVLSIIWSVVINCAVFIALFKYKKFSFWIHILFAWVVIALTLAGTMVLLLPNGFQIDSLDDVPLIQDVHNVAGFVLIFWMVLQVVFGIAARKIQQPISVQTSTVIIVKRIHRIFSYGILLIAIFNLLNRRYEDGDYAIFAIILAFQVVCIIAYIYLKLKYTKLTQEITDSQIKYANVQQVNSQGQLQSSYAHLQYAVFSDYVYDIKPLNGLHPGGQQVIQMMRERQIDRFLYGMYSAEYSAGVSPVQHSSRCLQLVGQPICKIKRTPMMTGLQELNQCAIVQKKKIALDSTTYLVKLKPYSGKGLKYSGYKQLGQFGQYFSLTMDDSVTRLYTSVFCMRRENQNFMEQYFPESTRLFKSDVQKNKKHNLELTEMQMMDQFGTARQRIQKSEPETIPLLIKKYQKGKVTPFLLNLEQDWDRKLILSQGKGSGMKFDTILEGKVIIVAGGTGILPFIDFLDILFKKILVLQNHTSKKTLIQRDDVLSKDFLKDKKFILLAAINSPLDLPSQSLFQINYLQKSKLIDFECQFKVKNNVDLMNRHFKDIPLSSKRFNDFVLQEAKQPKTMIYVCGPPQMNSSLVKLFLQNNIQRSKYLLL